MSCTAEAGTKQNEKQRGSEATEKGEVFLEDLLWRGKGQFQPHGSVRVAAASSHEEKAIECPATHTPAKSP